MVSRIVKLVIHTLHEGAVLALSRCGDDDFLGTGGNVASGFIRSGEKSGGFDDDIDAEFFPWKSIWRAGANNFDLVAVDDDDVVFFQLRGRFLGGNRAAEFALGGVVFEEVGEVVRRNDVTDGDNIEGGSEVALLDESTEDEATDAAESVDGDSSHNNIFDEANAAFPPGGRDCAREGRGVNPSLWELTPGDLEWASGFLFRRNQLVNDALASTAPMMGASQNNPIAMPIK